MDRRKAAYTERALNENEKIFLEKYHYLVFRYMKLHRLDCSDWYDELILPYIQSVKKYHENDDIKKYKFEQIFYRTLDNARSNYWRKLNRKKYCPEGGIYSYEGRVLNNYDVEEHIDLLECYFDKYTYEIMDDKINERLDIQNLINKFKKYEQKQIANMIIEGYCASEIQRKLGITSYKYKKMIQEMGNIIKAY